MPRYQVQHRYRSNDFGPWQAGDEVTLDNPDDAAYVNRDSPGTLVEVDPHEQADRKRAGRQAAELAAAKASRVPEGPISAVLEWVDKVPAAREHRIRKALEAERAKGIKGRTTLVETLEQLLAAEVSA
ncbi:MAG TPA: hypothetical protein VFM54_23360 [Micromonosporaceae bacterium]|nr:hypothetical protein [Micromonosporaceae bacterium]